MQRAGLEAKSAICGCRVGLERGTVALCALAAAFQIKSPRSRAMLVCPAGGRRARMGMVPLSQTCLAICRHLRRCEENSRRRRRWRCHGALHAVWHAREGARVGDWQWRSALLLAFCATCCRFRWLGGPSALWASLHHHHRPPQASTLHSAPSPPSCAPSARPPSLHLSPGHSTLPATLPPCHPAAMASRKDMKRADLSASPPPQRPLTLQSAACAQLAPPHPRHVL